MSILTLFLTFLKIGAVSFGGGYGIIALIQDEAVSNGWLTEEMLMNFIAVAESTPGPIAVNIATFVGSSQAGALGALAATLGVILPSFLVILLIAALFKTFIRNRYVQAVLSGIRPVIVGLILATSVTVFLGIFYINFGEFCEPPRLDWRGPAIAAVLLAFTLALRKFGKSPSPIVLILISAGLGMAAYAI